MKSIAAVYIAGPMTGYKDFNFPAFHAAEKFLKSVGFDAVGNPAAFDEETYGKGTISASETGDVKEAEAKGFNLRKALLRDTSFICSDATHLFMLEGWEGSKGARAEHALAVALGLEIIYQKAY